MNVREVKNSDAKKIAKVKVDTWRSTYEWLVPKAILDDLSYEQEQEKITNWFKDLANGKFIYVAENDVKEIVGFVFGGPERFGNPKYNGEIYAIYVLEDYQGKGVGKTLVYNAIKALKKHGIGSMIIWVLKANPYQAFYESLGGKVAGEMVGTVADTEIHLVGYGWDDIAWDNII